MLRVLCATVCLAVASPAMAASQPPPAALSVSAAGVDFRDPVAARAFYAKLRHAAGTVCDGYAGNSRVTQADVACADRAVAAAVRKLDRPALTALYEGRASSRFAANR